MERFRRINFLLVGIILLGVLLRLNIIQYVPLDFDVSRDLITASHIAKYKEFPATGPVNSLLSSVGNSPLYYYFLASLIYFNRDPNFVFYVNLVLQVVSILIVYFIGKEVFGKTVGLISALLVSVSRIIVIQSQFPYQPYFMYPILTLSLLFLVLSRKSNNVWRFIVSAVLLMISGAIHMSAFLLTPLFLAFGISVLRKGNVLKNLFLVFAISGMSFLILFFPIIKLEVHQANLIFSSVSYVTTQTISYFFGNFLYVSSNFLASLLNVAYPPSLENIFIITTLVLFLSTRLFKRKKIEIKFLVAILLQILFYISMIILFAGQEDQLYREHRFYPVFILGLISVAWFTNNIFEQYKYDGFLKVIFFVILAHSLMHGLPTNGIIYKSQDLANNKAIHAVEGEIVKLMGIEKNMRFFQIKVYECYGAGCNWRHYEYADTFFWDPLERDFDLNFIKITDGSYMELNNDKYIFLTCFYQSNAIYSASPCLNAFISEFPEHKIIETIVEENNLHVYLTKKSQN